MTLSKTNISHAIGSIDELQCALGIVLHVFPEHADRIRAIQRHLVQCSSVLSGAVDADHFNAELARCQIDTWNAELSRTLPPIESFILIGSSIESAQIHMARAISRRASLYVNESNQQIKDYLTNIAGFLFVLARLYTLMKDEKENTI